MATPVVSWSSVRRCASTMRVSSARIASASVASMPMPALPRRAGNGEHVEDAAAAGHDRRQPAGIGLRPLRGRATSSSRAARSNSSMPRSTRLGGIPGLDRARIGGVDEDELAGLVARPDRGRQRFDQRAQRVGFVDLLLVAGQQVGELALDAAHVLEPQDRAPADDLAFGLDRAAASVVERRGKADRRARAARRPRAPSLCALSGSSQVPKASTRCGASAPATSAISPMISGSSRPAAQATRICGSEQQQRIDAVDLGLERDDLVARRGFGLGEPRGACAPA